MRAGSAAGCSAPSRSRPTATPRSRSSCRAGVPIYLTYVTAQVRDGKIAYLADPYGWDPKGATGKAAGR